MLLRACLTALLAAPLLAADDPPKPAANPAVTINLLARHGHATPERVGFTHTGGGNIDVQQPAPDTVVVTMTGVAVAGAHPCKASSAAMDFDLCQDFDIAFEKPDLKSAKLTVEGRVIGLLRSESKGTAAEGNGCATVNGEGFATLSLCAPAHTVGGGENLSVNDRDTPVTMAVKPGKYTLHQTFQVSAAHPRNVLPCKAASAEFAPDPALDPLWISYWEPFHGAAKKDFGFRITIRVSPE